MRALNLFNKTSRQWPELDSLFIKLQGATPVLFEEGARILQRAAETHGGTGFEFAPTEAAAEELWNARKNVLFAGFTLAPGAKAMGTDVWCVLFSRAPHVIAVGSLGVA